MNILRICLIFLFLLPLYLHAFSVKVSPDTVKKLSNGQGYLLLDLNIKHPVSSIKFVRSDSSRGKGVQVPSLPIGRHLMLLPIKKGTYQWDTINVPHYDLPFRVNVRDDERWSFEIQKKTINYIGQLIVEKDRGTRYVPVRWLNRAASSLEEIKEKYGDLLLKYPLAFSGHARDDFLSDYFPQLQADSK